MAQIVTFAHFAHCRGDAEGVRILDSMHADLAETDSARCGIPNGKRGDGSSPRKVEGSWMIRRVRHLVFCTLVMPSSESGDCRQVELEMGKRGFQSRGAITLRGRDCVCSFLQEYSEGSVAQLRDEACAHVEEVARNLPGQWRGYVQVCGREGAWATLVAGKAPLFGPLENDEQFGSGS